MVTTQVMAFMALFLFDCAFLERFTTDGQASDAWVSRGSKCEHLYIAEVFSSKPCLISKEFIARIAHFSDLDRISICFRAPWGLCAGTAGWELRRARALSMAATEGELKGEQGLGVMAVRWFVWQCCFFIYRFSCMFVVSIIRVIMCIYIIHSKLFRRQWIWQTRTSSGMQRNQFRAR